MRREGAAWPGPLSRLGSARCSQSAAGAKDVTEQRPILVLYSRRECHLCEIAKADLLPLCDRYDVRLQEVDITGEPDLTARHGEEVPVAYLNGEKVFKYRVEPRRVKRLLKKAAAEARKAP